jgi:uncharacterized protein with FMN-binding domain
MYRARPRPYIFPYHIKLDKDLCCGAILTLAHTVFLPISYTFLKFVCYTEEQNLTKLCVFCKDKQAMKKAIVSLVIIGAFVIYSIIHAYSGLVAVVANTPGDSPSSSSSATTTSPIETTVTPNATQTPGSLYRDGSYTGSVADAQWGVVQVKAIISNGKITDVKFLQYPNDRNRSIYINSIADPQLTSEAIQAQSANVDIVTGATDSSDAFMQSLSDALAQAQA